MIAPDAEYLSGRWLVIADPTNEAQGAPLLRSMTDRRGLADRLEDNVGGFHESVYQFVDIPTKMPQ